MAVNVFRAAASRVALVVNRVWPTAVSELVASKPCRCASASKLAPMVGVIGPVGASVSENAAATWTMHCAGR